MMMKELLTGATVTERETEGKESRRRMDIRSDTQIKLDFEQKRIQEHGVRDYEVTDETSH